MKRLLVIFSLYCLALTCYSQDASLNTLTAKERQDNWQLLFDGKTTNGWHTFKKSTVNDAWKVKDGVLFLDTTKKDGKRQSGDIVTDEQFENYHLKLEWKISKNGNSGIIFGVKEDSEKYGATYHTGLEMQVLDNDGHADGKIHKHRSGDLYDLIASSKETVKPVGEWNLAEIIANKGNLQLFLNGTKVVATTMWDDNWKKMIAASKFKNMSDFAVFKEGRIALQDHGDAVYYRNIKIKRL